MSTETSCHFGHLLQVSKKSFWSLILYNFFMILYMYIPLSRSWQPLGDKILMSRGTSILSLRSFVANFKNKISLKSYLIHFFFMILFMYIAPGQGETTPRGQHFDVNRKALSFYQFVASFKEISLKSDFIHFFRDLIHVYSPGAGVIQPLGEKFWGQQKLFVTSVICC